MSAPSRRGARRAQARQLCGAALAPASRPTHPTYHTTPHNTTPHFLLLRGHQTLTTMHALVAASQRFPDSTRHARCRLASARGLAPASPYHPSLFLQVSSAVLCWQFPASGGRPAAGNKPPVPPPPLLNKHPQPTLTSFLRQGALPAGATHVRHRGWAGSNTGAREAHRARGTSHATQQTCHMANKRRPTWLATG